MFARNSHRNRGQLQALFLSALFAIGANAVAAAQVPVNLPPPGQAQGVLQQMLQQNPNLPALISAKLTASGLTPDQVRARLAASGYPPNLLDAYMGQQQPGQTTAPLAPGAQEISAIQALGLAPQGSSSLPIDTGMVSQLSRMQAESLAVGNYVFGVDVFGRSQTQFLPLLSGPVPSDYVLGPGDELVVILTGDVELSYDLQVTREGFILIPQVGQVFVASLTLDQLHTVLRTRLGKVYSGIKSGSTRFDVSVANVRANQVYVVGEVNQPGAYQISALGTVLTALYAAGGVTQRADLRAITVQRHGKTVDTLDLYDYLLHGDTHSDVRLQTGDVVFVTLHGTRAQITGAVLRPAIYELKPEESLADLVKAAGGFRPNASLRRLSIFRVVPQASRGPGPFPRVAVDVPLAIGKDSLVVTPPLPMATGDSVAVDSIPNLSGTLVVGINGMVVKPGQYPWHPGMTLRDLVLLARGPRVGADLKEAELARLPTHRTSGELAQTVRIPLDSTYYFERDSSGRYVGPPGMSFAPSGSPDVALEPYDNVLIFRQPDFELQRTVTVLGEVRYPGTYSLRSKTDRLAGLIGRAGGLTPQAYPDGIRFIRSENGVGRINVDLVQALADTITHGNLILQPDDTIVIPEFEPTVKVSGAVNAPGSVLWRQGQSLSDYIGAAGGYNFTADEGRVSVRYANGEVKTVSHFLFIHHKPTPGPGAEITVPAKDLSHPTDFVALFGAIAQILASTIAIIALATKL